MADRLSGPPARAFRTLLAGATLSSTGYLLVLSVTPLLSRSYLPDSGWIGLPNAALILGVAVGSPILAWLFGRWGRAPALALGCGVAALASAGIALSAWGGGAFWLHLAVSLVLGAGYAAYHQTRFTAALLVPPSRSGRAIGMVVWVAVAGAFVAPVLFGWIEESLAPGAGARARIPFAYAFAAVFYAGAGLVFARSRTLRAQRALGRARPAGDTVVRKAPDADSPGLDSPAPDPAFRRTFALALVSLVSAQAGMMILMTMAPLQVVAGGGSFAGLGAMMGAHNLGMFLLSPLVGVLCDRVGERPVIALGGGTLAGAGLLAAFGPGGGAALGIALYLVGLGWCFAFVAASTLLSGGPDSPAKVRRQGLADSLNWSCAGAACIASGLLMTRFGFEAVAFACAALGVVSLAGAIVRQVERSGRGRSERRSLDRHRPLGRNPLP